MDWLPLNLNLMKSPVNWLIVILMVALAGMMLSLLFPPVQPATAE